MSVEDDIIQLRKRMDELVRSQAELDARISTRVSAAEEQTSVHGLTDRDAFDELRRKVAQLQETVTAIESAHEVTSMAQMHILGLVARKVGVSQKELKKIKVL